MKWPTATYRLQFGGAMDFAAAARLAPYLRDLGISHLYASPVFEARPGSDHGYDVTDPNRISEALGGYDGFEAMARAYHREGLAVLLDIVPNHMAASADTPWFADMLRHGPQAEAARIFDVDWARGDGRLILPVLGQPIEAVLQAGELTRVEDAALGPCLAYYDKRFPLAPDTPADAGLEACLAHQHFELVYWRDLHRLNYRRFFEINDLICVRQEDPAVFEASHKLIAHLVREGLVAGLRVDHIDGLWDPKGYLDRLAALFPDAAQPPPIWVEKILEGEERLPADWAVAGETGYGILSDLDALFVPEAAAPALSAAYQALTGEPLAFAPVAADAKRLMIDTAFDHEFDSLAAAVAGQMGRRAAEVRPVLGDLAVAFPVYRTYLRAGAACDRERRRLGEITDRVRTGGGIDPLILDQLLGVLSNPDQPAALRFQQMTGPVMAKAVEDTAFYRHVRCLALNEVGGAPDRVGLSVAAFHARMAARAEQVPATLSATATHDTKRGEDVRARLIALARTPERWAEIFHHWFQASRADRAGVRARDVYALLQTALGFWPTEGDEPADRQALAERLAAYALKAAREAKQETAWTERDEAYEARLTAFARTLCTGPLSDEIARTAQDLAPAAADIAIARLVLKALVPGIPDIYQGCEGLDLSLVDPDNRRPVDFQARQDLLRSGGQGASARKMAATAALLRLRRAVPDVMAAGDYRPRPAGPGQLGFARRLDGQEIVLAVALAPGPALPARPDGQTVLDDAAAWVVRR